MSTAQRCLPFIYGRTSTQALFERQLGLQVLRLSIERHTHALVSTNHRTHTKSTPPGTAADRRIFLAYQLLATRVNSSSAPFRTT